MASYQSSGQATQTSRSAFSEKTSSLASEIFRELPLGLAILYMEDPDDIRSYKIVDVNPAAVRIAGSTPEGLRGRTLAEFPTLLEPPQVARWLNALHAHKSEPLNQRFKGDERLG